MGIDRLNQMPLTILEVFCCRREDKARGVTTDDNRLSIQIKQVIAITGDIQVRQTFCFNLDKGTISLAVGFGSSLYAPLGA